MATQDSHGTLEPTDYETPSGQGRALALRLREAGMTIADAVTTALDIRPGPDFRPDGDWYCADDTPARKTWVHTASEYEERVQLTSDGLSGTWTVVHQRIDGTTATVATDLERERAYEIAEEFMADLASVPVGIRTGRAAE